MKKKKSIIVWAVIAVAAIACLTLIFLLRDSSEPLSIETTAVSRGDVANIVTAQLLFLESTDNAGDITIYMNTPGGSVSAGLGIYDTMQLVEPDVCTVCTGMAASMGAILLCAGTKGKRSALPHSRVMIHQPLGGAQGQASDIEIAAREIVKMKHELYSIISEHSGQPVEKIVADGDRDYWMSSSEALEYGMIDEILSKKRNRG